jgi:hypothetical protein
MQPTKKVSKLWVGNGGAHKLGMRNIFSLLAGTWDGLGNTGITNLFYTRGLGIVI